jgi:hypothetical protein
VSTNLPFTYIKHLIAIPACVNDSFQMQFILDTGIGFNIIAKSLCNQIEYTPTGIQHSGKRMSGQELFSDLVTIPSISIGPYREENVIAGIFDSTGFPTELSETGGFIGLPFFEKIPFTIDYVSNNVILGSAISSPSRLKRDGIEVPLRLVKDSPSIDAFLQLSLPNGEQAMLEVDTGSDILILHLRFMKELRLYENSIKKVEGKDETGHLYTRYFAKLRGQISLAGVAEIYQQDPEVMFQDIIYDGLLGQPFLKLYSPTYDVANSKMIF